MYSIHKSLKKSLIYIIDPCGHRPCRHGTCKPYGSIESSTEDDYLCYCDAGWTGKHCDSGTYLKHNSVVFINYIITYMIRGMGVLICFVGVLKSYIKLMFFNFNCRNK